MPTKPSEKVGQKWYIAASEGPAGALVAFNPACAETSAPWGKDEQTRWVKIAAYSELSTKSLVSATGSRGSATSSHNRLHWRFVWIHPKDLFFSALGTKLSVPIALAVLPSSTGSAVSANTMAFPFSPILGPGMRVTHASNKVSLVLAWPEDHVYSRRFLPVSRGLTLGNSV
ncbi:hypothetical protein BO83DRAFT_446588 [Aspergillus eucalypticola CBS 122712]|uniref:Uncharacterized protein n=1 Tax=Aspergillus eucalypticola (strain CBS 122712 / IBT 29274) TaxID=1448314 RepID=A0A317V9Z1_ASPEC|nr:uncharacterized protein BO83DRAFT_446588 [Aspergillus eucalypticola CBS 122712]PWY71163.1 hypothetical protein BO83DRAFT_446588 [Aspergillus eucalypticola CBS 122712]